MERLIPLEKDYYCIEEDQSDREFGSESSDDDEMKATFAKLAGVVSCPTKVKRRQNIEENDFDAEMDKELTSMFDARNNRWLSSTLQPLLQHQSVAAEGVLDGQKACASNAATEVVCKNDEEETELDPKDTESDEDFCATEALNEREGGTDLFYDPNSDQDNQDWVDSHRQTGTVASRRLPNSDAVLNCPCCMGVLCYDCQRHDLYHTQYRAMFVVNCVVQNDHVLFHPSSRTRNANKRKLNVKTGQKLTTAPEGCDPKDLFRSVLCAHCNTEVAVYDIDEIYHFFNVLASYT